MSVEWDNQYILGEPALDAQHKVLVGLVIGLQRAVDEGRAESLLDGTLQKLIGYVQYHFEFEEEWFERHNLVSLASHRDEHIRFTDDVLDLQTRLDAGELAIGTPLLRLLLAWLYEHICIRDRMAVESIRRTALARAATTAR